MFETPDASSDQRNSATPPRSDDTAFFGGIALSLLAATLLLCGACATVLYILAPLSTPSRAQAVQSNTAIGTLAGFGIFFGALVVWQAYATLRGHASFPAARVFPHILVFVFLFALALVLGLSALALEPIAAYAFPPFHFLAAAAPPLALVAYAAQRLGAASGLRALIVAFGWGAMGATALAMTLEIAIALFFLIVAALFLAAQPNSQALLRQLQTQVDLARRTQDFTIVSQWLTDPWVIVPVLIFVAVLVPFLEEAFKTIVVAFIDPRRTRRADALLWGIAAGAGFASFENLFNTAGGLTLWAPLAFMRIGATAMHVANGAIMGRGWYAARVERRWSRLAIAYIVCVIFHAAWNAAAILLTSGASFYMIRSSASPETALPAAALIAALLAALVILTSFGFVWIVHAVRSAQESAERSE